MSHRRKPSGHDGDGRARGELIEHEGEWTIVVEVPKQTTFSCPLCETSFNIFSSLTRHLKLKHPKLNTTILHRCWECGEQFQNRKELGTHSKRSHDNPPALQPKRLGEYPCSFCDESFASERSRSGHERSQHPILVSKKLAIEAAKDGRKAAPRPDAALSQASQPVPWPVELTNSLIRAMFVVGTASNAALVKEMGTSKTPHQVGSTKCRILRKYPDWKATFSYLNPDNSPLTSSSDNSTTDEESDEQEATPHREDSQEEQTGTPHTIVIAYPLQVTLDCPFCETYYQGRDLLEFAKHIDSAHVEACQWMFMCALCAAHTSTEDELLEHLLQEHAAELVSLPKECFQQGRNTITNFVETLTREPVKSTEPRDSPKCTGENTEEIHLTAVEHESVEPTPTSPLSSASITLAPGQMLEDDSAEVPSPTPTDQEDVEVPPLPPPLPCMEGYVSPPHLGSPIPDVLPSSLYSPISDAPLPPSPKSPATATDEPALPLEPTSPQPPPPGIPRRPPGGKDKDREAEERKKKLKALNSKFQAKLAPLLEDDEVSDWDTFEQVLLDLSVELREATSRNIHRENTQRGSQHNNNSQARNWRKRQRGKQRNAPDHNRRHQGNEGHSNPQGEGNEQHNRGRISGRQRWIREAQKVQGAYRRNAKRCVAQITGEEKPREDCPIPMETLSEWMANSNPPPPGEKPSWIEEPSDSSEDVLSSPFSPSEVLDQLRRLPGKSAPGPDKITYWQWKQLDGQGKLLSVVFNICRKATRVPQQWKESTTTLIYKGKGEKSETCNW